MRNWSLCLLLAAASAWSCATTRGTPDSRPVATLSAEREAQIGVQADRELRRQSGVLADAALLHDVQQAGTQLAAGFDSPPRSWHITVLDLAAPNAFALPGGYVYLTHGLLPYLSSHAELSAVLAHEMAHAVSGDATADYLAGDGPLPEDLGVFRTVARLFGSPLTPAIRRALFASHDQDKERAANARAGKALSAAGFDPASLNVVLETLDRLDLDTDERGVPVWGMTHARGGRLDVAPAFAAPSATASAGLAPAAAASAPAADDGFAERLRGLLFGDDPRQGLVRANQFLAPNLQVAMTIPEQWDVSSDRTRMIAASPDHDAFIVLQLVPPSRRRQLAATAEVVAVRAGLVKPVGKTTTINGLQAFVATTTGKVDGLGEVRVRMACLQTLRGQFVVAGVAGRERFADVEKAMAAAIQSVRLMSAAEIERILPSHVEREAAEPGDTWDTVARRHGGVVMASLLAILNHAPADRPPLPGAKITVVVASEK